jgi:hypothetical protein
MPTEKQKTENITQGVKKKKKTKQGRVCDARI